MSSFAESLREPRDTIASHSDISPQRSLVSASGIWVVTCRSEKEGVVMLSWVV